MIEAEQGGSAIASPRRRRSDTRQIVLWLFYLLEVRENVKMQPWDASFGKAERMLDEYLCING